MLFPDNVTDPVPNLFTAVVPLPELFAMPALTVKLPLPPRLHPPLKEADAEERLLFPVRVKV